jgi:hypothetical protein
LEILVEIWSNSSLLLFFSGYPVRLKIKLYMENNGKVKGKSPQIIHEEASY